jgi:2-keto-4-pentenoate hydratase
MSAAVVERLLRARDGGGLVAPATADLPELDERQAYAIQREVAGRAGVPLTGWKVGMVSAIGRGTGTPGPIYGRLLADMEVADGGAIPSGALHAPEVEGEIAFVVGAPLRGPGVTVADVLAATRGVLPAIEIFAGRLEPGEHGVPDLIADNASSARYVVGAGETLVAPDGLDLRLVGMVHTRGDSPEGGAVVGAGAGARVLGHPAAAVAWLANALAANGEPAGLEPGQLVLSGSLAPPVPAQPGDAFTVELDRLGSLSVVFER